MNQKRAFASAVCLGDESVYVFGGLADFDATNSIEQYDTAFDKWSTLYIRLPLKCAKVGVAPLDRYSVVLVGGVYGDAQ